MLRRLLATFALITGLAAMATPAEASWKRVAQVPAVAAAAQAAATIDHHLAVEQAEQRQRPAAAEVGGDNRTSAAGVLARPVVLKADRALE